MHSHQLDSGRVCAGKKEMEKEILMLEEQFPDDAKGIAEFSTPLAHQIIAGVPWHSCNLTLCSCA